METEMDTNRPLLGYSTVDISTLLLVTSITFVTLETMLLALLYISRYFAKCGKTNMAMDIFLTLAYIIKTAMALRLSSKAVLIIFAY